MVRNHGANCLERHAGTEAAVEFQQDFYIIAHGSSQLLDRLARLAQFAGRNVTAPGAKGIKFHRLISAADYVAGTLGELH